MPGLPGSYGSRLGARTPRAHGSVVAVALPVPSSPATLAGIIGTVNRADSASSPPDIKGLEGISRTWVEEAQLEQHGVPRANVAPMVARSGRKGYW